VSPSKELKAPGALGLGVTVIWGGGSLMFDARDEARAGSKRRLPLSAGDDENPALEGVTGREECPLVPLRAGTGRLFLGSRPLESLRLFPLCLFSPCGAATTGLDPIEGAPVPDLSPDAVLSNLSPSSFVDLTLTG